MKFEHHFFSMHFLFFCVSFSSNCSCCTDGVVMFGVVSEVLYLLLSVVMSL